LIKKENINLRNNCDKGHEMELEFKRPENYSKKVGCVKCKKPIDVDEGFYHCLIDSEDYHQGCLKEAR